MGPIHLGPGGIFDLAARLGYARRMPDAPERRQFPRLDAPVFSRPVGRPLFARMRTRDISLGGARLYSDDPHAKGDRLELELLLPDQSEIACRVEVVWIEELPQGSPARYDVGVRFVALAAGDRDRLQAVLKQE